MLKINNLKTESAIFIAAFIPRFLAFIFFRKISLATDVFREYFPLANSLVTGEGYSIGGLPTAIRMPLYPLFLASIKLLCSSRLFIPVTQLILITGECFVCIFIYKIGVLIFNKRIALISALLNAFYLFPVYYSLRLSTETFFTFFLIGAVMFFIAGINKNKFSLNILSFIFLSLAALIKSMALILPFLFCIFLLLFQKKTKDIVSKMAICFLVYLLLLAPWTLRNYIVFDVFLPQESLLGLVVYKSANLFSAQIKEGRKLKKKKHMFESNNYILPGVPSEKQYEKQYKKRLADAGKKRFGYGFKRLNFFKGKKRNEAKRSYFYLKKGIRRYKMVFTEKFLESSHLLLKRFWDVCYRTSSGKWEKMFLILHGVIAIMSFAGFILVKEPFRCRGSSMIAILISCFIVVYMAITPIVRYIVPIVPLVLIGFSISINYIFSFLWPKIFLRKL